MQGANGTSSTLLLRRRQKGQRSQATAHDTHGDADRRRARPRIVRRRDRHGVLIDDRPTEFELEYSPGLDEREIDDLEASVGTRLPAALREVLACTGEIIGPIDFDFTGRSMAFEFEAAFPSGLPIAADGFGNFWVVDLPSEQIWFAAHDPPIILVQSPDLAHFVTETMRMWVPPHESLVDAVHEDRLFDVWRSIQD